jgi:hypothetical protein
MAFVFSFSEVGVFDEDTGFSQEHLPDDGFSLRSIHPATHL